MGSSRLQKSMIVAALLAMSASGASATDTELAQQWLDYHNKDAQSDDQKYRLVGTADKDTPETTFFVAHYSQLLGITCTPLVEGGWLCTQFDILGGGTILH